MTTPNQGASPALRSMELTSDELQELKSRAAAGYACKQLTTGGGGDGLFIMQTRRELEQAKQTDQVDPSESDINNLNISPVPNSELLILSGNQAMFEFLRSTVMLNLLDEGVGLGLSSVDIIEGPVSGPRSTGQELYARLHEISMRADTSL